MKVEFELTLDQNGRPCIKFKHRDRNDSLEQKILKVFIDAVKEKGCELINTGVENIENNIWSEIYEIQIGKKK